MHSFVSDWLTIGFTLYRRLMVLEDSYGQAAKEMAGRQAQLKEVRPSSAKMKMDMHHIKTMENQLDKALVTYSAIQASNKSVRAEIDVMRKQMKKQRFVNDG